MFNVGSLMFNYMAMKLSYLARFIGTERFFSQVVSGTLIRAGTAAPAHLQKFAAAAFSPVFSQIPELIEDSGVIPDIFKFLFFELPAVNLKKSTWLHLSGI